MGRPSGVATWGGRRMGICDGQHEEHGNRRPSEEAQRGGHVGREELKMLFLKQCGVTRRAHRKAQSATPAEQKD